MSILERTIQSVILLAAIANDYIYGEYHPVDGFYYGYFYDFDYLGVHLCL